MVKNICMIEIILILLINSRTSDNLSSAGIGPLDPSSCNPDLVFSTEPQNLEVAEGNLLELMCRVSDQDATLTWFKDGQRLDSGKYSILFNIFRGSG